MLELQLSVHTLSSKQISHQNRQRRPLQVLISARVHSQCSDLPLMTSCLVASSVPLATATAMRGKGSESGITTQKNQIRCTSKLI